jgi:hypothetical protein
LTLKSNILKRSQGKAQDLLTLELAEVKDIADLIFKRLNRKIEVLEAIETSVDEKLRVLEKLIKKAESCKTSLSKLDCHSEILSLGRKGVKSRDIADRLDIPVGEVELILSLRGMAGANSN